MTRLLLSAAALAVCGLAADAHAAPPTGFACGTRANSSAWSPYSSYGSPTAASYLNDYRYGYGTSTRWHDPSCNCANCNCPSCDCAYPASRGLSNSRPTYRANDTFNSVNWNDRSRWDSRGSDRLPQSRSRNVYDDWRYDNSRYNNSWNDLPTRYRY